MKKETEIVWSSNEGRRLLVKKSETVYEIPCFEVSLDEMRDLMEALANAFHDAAKSAEQRNP